MHVGDEVIQCFAVELMKASPVIRQMLLSDIREGHEGYITLERGPREFREFLRHLETTGGKEAPRPTHEDVLNGALVVVPSRSCVA